MASRHSPLHLQRSRHMNHSPGGRSLSQDREERAEITHQLTAPRGTRPRSPRGASGVLARGWVHIARSQHRTAPKGGAGAGGSGGSWCSCLLSCQHFFDVDIMGTEPIWDTTK